MHVGSRQEGYRAQLYHWLAFSGFYTDLPSSSQSTVCRYITVLIEQVFRGISSDQNVQCFVHAGSLKMALSVVDPSFSDGIPSTSVRKSQIFTRWAVDLKYNYE